MRGVDLLTIALLVVAVASETLAQATIRPTARRYEDGPLTRADFGATPPAVRGFTNAYTYTSIEYSYRFRSQATSSGVRLVATDLSAYAAVKPDQSWNRMPEDARLMEHEQGHFDITQLHTQRWRRHAQRLIDRAAFTGQGATQASAEAALQQTINKEFLTFYEAWQAEQRRYDDETSHGSHRGRQAEWRQRLDAELKGKTASGRSRP